MGIREVIKKHDRIMIDTAPIIYFIEEHDNYLTIIDEIFKIIRDDSNYQAFSSVITLIEVLSQPLRKSRMELVDKYKQFLLNSANFVIFSIDPIIAEKAAEIRAQYGMRTPDAIQIATGIENGASLFITNDRNLSSIKEIDILVLEDYLN